MVWSRSGSTPRQRISTRITARRGCLTLTRPTNCASPRRTDWHRLTSHRSTRHRSPYDIARPSIASLLCPACSVQECSPYPCRLRRQRLRLLVPSPSVWSRPSTPGSRTSAGALRNSSAWPWSRPNATKALKGWTIKVRALDDSSDPAKGGPRPRSSPPTRTWSPIGPYNSGVASGDAPHPRQNGDRARLTVEHAHVTHPRRPPAHRTRTYPDYFRLVAPDSLQAGFLCDTRGRLASRTRQS